MCHAGAGAGEVTVSVVGYINCQGLNVCYTRTGSGRGVAGTHDLACRSRMTMGRGGRIEEGREGGAGRRGDNDTDA